jgi:hypothetical protein
MATAALSITNLFDAPQNMGYVRVQVATVTFDSAYAASGETLTPGLLGLTTIYWASAGVDTARKSLWNVTWDSTNGVLQAWKVFNRDSADTSSTRGTFIHEAATNYNLSTLSCRMTFIGR